MLKLTLLLSIAVYVLCQQDYKGYALFRLLSKEDDDFDSLRKLLKDNKVDTWGLPSNVIGNVSILIPPGVVEEAKRELTSADIDFYIITEDIQDWIDQELRDNPPDNYWDGFKEDFRLDIYHTFEAINGRMSYNRLRHFNLTEDLLIGTTHEGNPIRVLKIGSNSTEPSNKPAIWIHSGIHSRDWINPAISLYVIERLLNGYNTDPEIQKLLNTYDLYILPVLNPDGYQYSWSFDRLWRKNRTPTVSNSTCKGIDLNRNFAVGFVDSPSAMDDPCLENYRGPKAFSEIETKVIRDNVLQLGSRLKAYIGLHNFGQQLMSPYGYTRDLPPDYEDHMKALEVIKEAVESVNGQNYTKGTISEIKFFAAGIACDWIYEAGNIKYSFNFEVRDVGYQGFLLHHSQILPTAEENFAGMMAFAKYLRTEL